MLLNTVIIAVSRIAGANEYSCNCYTQQGSVSPVSVKYCYAYLQKRPFNPYKVPDDNRYSMGTNENRLNHHQSANR